MDKFAILQKAAELKRECLACKNCELHKNIVDDIDPHVYGYGNLASPVIFLAEAPGADEARLKIPLIGKSGQLFEKRVLEPLELARSDVWITNTALCRPPGNRKPTMEEKERCLPHLRAQFEIINPKLVVTLGATPMETMLGIESGITKLAGQKFRSQKFNVDVFALLHPSYFLRGNDIAILDAHVKILKPIIYSILDAA